MLKKPWWEKRRKENAIDKTHYKDWCVVKVVRFNISHPKGIEQEIRYKACAKLNAPVTYSLDGIPRNTIVSNNLTKHEAHSVAKLLNTTQGELL